MLWDSYLFLGVNTILDIGDLLFVVLSCNHTQCRGMATYSYLYIRNCNLIVVNLLRDHHVGRCRAAASAPISIWFQSLDSFPPLFRVCGLTESMGCRLAAVPHIWNVHCNVWR